MSERGFICFHIFTLWKGKAPKPHGAFSYVKKMREFAEHFYNSVQWKNVRNNYWHKHPLCEDCLEKGLISPTEIIHHKVELSPQNINDSNITLNENNLRAVCRKCHGKHHRRRRYKTDELGRIVWD